jgi:hypothetical protein
MEVNLENPIFVFYINVDGMTRQRAKEQIAVLSEHMNYQNITKWIIPIKHGESKVELIWQGSRYSQNPGILKTSGIQNVIEHINDVLGIIIDSTNDESIRAQLRELQLKKLFL